MARKKTSKDDPATKGIVLIDSCLPGLENCRRGCAPRRSKVRCRHRLKFNCRVVHCTPKRFDSVPDIGIILYFIKLVFTRLTVGSGANDTDQFFILITKDNTFLESAEREWRARKKDNKGLILGKKWSDLACWSLDHGVEILFGGDKIYVKIGHIEFIIYVQKIFCRKKKHQTYKTCDQLCAITKINCRLGKFKKELC